jgi:hypothetical protein
MFTIQGKYVDKFPREELQTQEYSVHEYMHWLRQVIWKLPYSAISSISDGYHTFEELYTFRKVYNAALFNDWSRQGKYDVHKAYKHHDGQPCFDGNWFIVVAVLPTGQISNHYKLEDWGLFDIPALDTAIYPYDGHTPQDVIERLKNLVVY